MLVCNIRCFGGSALAIIDSEYIEHCLTLLELFSLVLAHNNVSQWNLNFI
ncbi:hypothetical protein SAY87_010619 [Trapa incisa]|uniref:Uncharacterized protein n=1 Tax=Trapa incisa TaxID=236973 RepID=A0AAN7JI53_9MYRT|nr:hypothetical protein SAY87_010619 [Trapa incisa]